MVQAETDKALVGGSPILGWVKSRLAARSGGQAVHPARQFLDLARLTLARAGMSVQEYHDQRVYDPGLTAQERVEFLGAAGSVQLNRRLAPPDLTQMQGFLTDQVNLLSLLAARGMPTAAIRAVFAPDRFLGDLPTLRSQADIEAFLRDTETFPLLGKPLGRSDGSQAIVIERVDPEAGTATLRSGRVAGLWDLAAGITHDFPGGNLFQDAVQQHPALERIVGKTVAAVRLFTVIEDTTPRVLYALWKLPSPRAMSDDFWQDGSMIAQLDPAGGIVLKCRRGLGQQTEWLDMHPVGRSRLVGLELPNWIDTVQLAIDAHALFPSVGQFGWDIAIGPDGPVLLECTTNPDHRLYQMAAGRGMRNPDFGAAFSRVTTRNARLGEAAKARHRDTSA